MKTTSNYSQSEKFDSVHFPGRYKIPFNRAYVSKKESKYIAEALASGHLSGDGSFTKKVSKVLEEKMAVKKALLTTSCTHALEMAALLLDIQPGDEVLVPSFTFVSTINAFVLRGAHPIFVDVRPDTLNIDEKLIAGKITNKTKAIIPVHYAGVGAEMDTISNIAREHEITIVEDNAHGLLGKYKGRNLGTFGQLATQSFHETKNFSCGEGGALIINDEKYAERAEIIREKGTNRSRFYRGQVDKYTWQDIGSSYLPSDILAAILLSQLQEADYIQQNRSRIWHYYHKHLSDWAQKNNVTMPTVPEHCQQPYHMFYVLMPSLESRQNLIKHLQEKGILSVYHYLPLHLSDMGKKFGGKISDCPVTEAISDKLLRLPMYVTLSEQEQSYIVESILDFNQW